MAPLVPDAKRLVAPRAETDLLDDGGGEDFFPAEDAPGDGVDVVGVHFEDVVVCRVGVGGEGGLKVAVCVCGEPGNFLVTVLGEGWFEGVVEVGAGAEEFDEGFLEDKAFALRAPAEDGVVAADAVDGGLRGEGPPAAAFDEFEEFGADHGGFGVETPAFFFGAAFGPRDHV